VGKRFGQRKGVDGLIRHTLVRVPWATTGATVAADMTTKLKNTARGHLSQVSYRLGLLPPSHNKCNFSFFN
jgi:hypothetical protein